MTDRITHETRDLPPLGIALALAGIFVLIAISGVAVAALLHGIEGRTRPVDIAPFPPQARVGPPLEVDQAAERLAIEAAARARLESYGWADREAGIARIPVERATAILAGRGWPEPEPAPPRSQVTAPPG